MDLIDRQAAIDTILSGIMLVPSAKPKRKTGKWFSIGYFGIINECSECGKRHILDTNFCPDCGADMRG